MEQEKMRPDRAVTLSRIQREESTTLFSILMQQMLEPDGTDESSVKKLNNFIYRRELYRKACAEGKVPAYLVNLWNKLYGTNKPRAVVSRYVDNEVRVQYSESGNPTPPPPNFGARFTLGLTSNARSKLRQGVNVLSKGGRQTLAFITLSYSDEALPTNHKVCKTQLSTFFKALKRHREGTSYVWVAEIQPKRLKVSGVSAIHFHIAVDKFIDCDWLRECWRRITKCSVSRPNVIKVRKPAHYMAKYVSKNSSIDEGEFIFITNSEGIRIKQKNPDFHWIGGDRYGMSHDISKLLKPLESVSIGGDFTSYEALVGRIAFDTSVNWVGKYSVSFRIGTKTPLQDLLTD